VRLRRSQRKGSQVGYCLYYLHSLTALCLTKTAKAAARAKRSGPGGADDTPRPGPRRSSSMAKSIIAHPAHKSTSKEKLASCSGCKQRFLRSATWVALCMRLPDPSLPVRSRPRASPIGVRTYGHERGAGLSADPTPLGAPRQRGPHREVGSRGRPPRSPPPRTPRSSPPGGTISMVAARG
jgi:hypothetical protein